MLTGEEDYMEGREESVCTGKYCQYRNEMDRYITRVQQSVIIGGFG